MSEIVSCCFSNLAGLKPCLPNLTCFKPIVLYAIDILFHYILGIIAQEWVHNLIFDSLRSFVGLQIIGRLGYLKPSLAIFPIPGCVRCQHSANSKLVFFSLSLFFKR